MTDPATTHEIPLRSYVAGEWITGDTAFPVENPADETIVADLPATPVAEIGRAIGAARDTFDRGTWADLPVADRARVLHAFLDHLEADIARIAPLVVAEAGQSPAFAENLQLRGGIALGRDTIELYRTLPAEAHNPVPVDDLVRGRVALSLRRHEPIGVVSAITPYNGALIMAFQKVVPALLAGNSVILRPSPLTPLSSLAFGEAADAAGLPPGVLSVVVEGGAEGAALLTTDPRVDMVSFTGSTAVGRAILAQAAPTVKRVSLELGGKSCQLYLPDALERVVPGALAVVMATAGQACVAATRMLVPEDAKAGVLDAVGEAYAGLEVGPPSDPTAALGPLISAGARARVESILERSQEQGGKVVTGGGRPAHLPAGYYVEPTVVDAPGNDDPAAREEIFGPVLTVIGYRDLEHAVEIANDTEYGLSNQVYGADTAAATAVGRRLRSGAVNVNTALFSGYAPGGGYKQSGLGRERGTEGIREFQEVKHLVVGQLPR